MIGGVMNPYSNIYNDLHQIEQRQNFERGTNEMKIRRDSSVKSGSASRSSYTQQFSPQDSFAAGYEMNPAYEAYSEMFQGGSYHQGMNVTQQHQMNNLAHSMNNMSVNQIPSPVVHQQSQGKLVLEPGLLQSSVQRVPRSSFQEKASLYKTELCKKWQTTGNCRYGNKCQFAHGVEELRTLVRHPLYKTTHCKTFRVTGTCRYGSRCRFIHDESPLELNSVIRMNARQSAAGSQELSSSFDSVQQPNPPHPTPAAQQPAVPLAEQSVRFNEALDVKRLSRKPSELGMNRRVPSAPANLNLLGLDTIDLALANEGDEVLHSLRLEEEEQRRFRRPLDSFERKMVSDRDAMKRNLTFHGLNEANSHLASNFQQENFKLRNSYKHTSASMSNFPQYSEANEDAHLFGAPMNAKDLPVAPSQSPEPRLGLNDVHLNTGSRLSSLEMESRKGLTRNVLSASRLNQLKAPLNRRSFQHLPSEMNLSLRRGLSRSEAVSLNNLSSKVITPGNSSLNLTSSDKQSLQMEFLRNVSNADVVDLP